MLCDIMKKEWKATHQHKKGGLYRVLYDSVLSSDNLSLYVVYDDNSGRVWVKPKDEFDDGRFQKVMSDRYSFEIHYDRTCKPFWDKAQ
jgi:hypothetical protein